MSDGKRLECLEHMKLLEHALSRSDPDKAMLHMTNILKRLIDDQAPDVKEFHVIRPVAEYLPRY